MIKLDLVGKKFGRWIVLSQAGINNHRKSLWLCKCECGTEKVIVAGSLTNGLSKSCGCYHEDKISKNLRSKKFGRLLVLDKVGKNKDNALLWKCVCDCGNEVVVKGRCLIAGNTKSCGCLQKDYFNRKFKVSLVGRRFNRLLVLKYYGSNSHKNALWECKCDCGNTVVVSSNCLMSGHSGSCGCYVKFINGLKCGPKSSNWKGGISYEPYCDAWRDKEYKKSILERDDFRCQNTNCNKIYKRLNIHHIDYNKKNCHPTNLITLCISCNAKANFNRQKWQKIYKEVMVQRSIKNVDNN